MKASKMFETISNIYLKKAYKNEIILNKVSILKCK